MDPLKGRLCKLDCSMFCMACVELADVMDMVMFEVVVKLLRVAIMSAGGLVVGKLKFKSL